MLLQRIAGAVLVAASTAQAFKAAAPFFMLSSNPLSDNALVNTQLATAADVQDRLVATLSANCKRQDAASHYILVQQPGVKASDVRRDMMPQLWSWLEKKGSTSSERSSVPEVLGTWDLLSLTRRLASACDDTIFVVDEDNSLKSDTPSAVVPFMLPALNEGMTEYERATGLGEAHAQIDELLRSLDQQGRPWVLVFSGSQTSEVGAVAPPHDEQHQDLPYEMDEPYPSPLHTDLKRDVAQYSRRQSSGNGTDNAQAGLPLFEKYQFLSPAIFMGLLVSILLISILYVGVSAIAGLEVSYAAFSKEMGPQAQKGKQQ